MSTPVALTIAGSDPSGGAGLQADLKTFHQHHVYGMSVVTLLTVQNTQSVSRVDLLDPQLVLDQLVAVLTDIPPQATKIGALGSAETIAVIAEYAQTFSFPLVVDPVMISKHGQRLLQTEAMTALIEKLLPQTFLLTPNLPEASELIGQEIDSLEAMEQAAQTIAGLGPEHVLLKGGHLAGDAVDVLWSNQTITHFRSPRQPTPHTHGTGCVTSAAITARLAKGELLIDAVHGAKQFITRAIQTAPQLGHGHGPVNLFAT